MESKDGDVASASETSHLLLLLAEPLRCGVRQVALDFVSEGLRRWDAGVVAGADLSAALDAVANVKPKPSKLEGDESVASYSGFGVSVSVVFNCRLSGVRRHLASTFRHAHYALVLFAGSCDDATGAWILADGVFSPPDLDAVLQSAPPGVFEEAAIAADESSLPPASSRRFHLHLPIKGGFLSSAAKNMSSSAAAAATQLTVTDASDEFQPLQMEFDFTANLMETVEREVREPHEDSLLSTPGPAGALTKKDLTVYVFPAEDSDCFLLSVRGFTMLVNGGHAIRSCFWSMVGSLESLDVLAITHLGHDNILGLSTLLSRKLKDGASAPPQIDHLFFNALELPKSGEGETNGVDEAAASASSPASSMGVSLAAEGKRILDQLHGLDLTPHPWAQAAKDPATPIQLYCKIGFGRLCMYLINPTEDGPELATFLAQWKSGAFGVDAATGLPTPDEASVAFVLVWYPDNPKKVPTRLLYPGRCSAAKLTRGLDRLKDVAALRGFDGKPPPTVNKTAPSASKPGAPAAASKEKSPRPAAGARRPGVGGRKAAEESSGVAAKNGPAAPPISTTSPSAANKKAPSKPAGSSAPLADKKPAAAPAAKSASTLAAKKEPAAPAARKEATTSSATAKKEPVAAAGALKKEPVNAKKEPVNAKKEPLAAKKEPPAAAKKDAITAKPVAAAAATKKEAPIKSDAGKKEVADKTKKDPIAKSPIKKEATPKKDATPRKDAVSAKKDSGASPAPKKEAGGAAKPAQMNGQAAGSKLKSPSPTSKASAKPSTTTTTPGRAAAKKGSEGAKPKIDDDVFVVSAIVGGVAAEAESPLAAVRVEGADAPFVDGAASDVAASPVGEAAIMEAPENFPVADVAVVALESRSDPILDQTAGLIQALGLADDPGVMEDGVAAEIDAAAAAESPKNADNKGADAAAAAKRIDVASALDADDLAERARAVLSNGGDLAKGVSPPPSIEITTCESAPDSEDEEEGFQPLVEEKPAIEVDHDSLDSLEPEEEPLDSLEADEGPMDSLEAEEEETEVVAAANAEVDRVISAAVAVAEAEAAAPNNLLTTATEGEYENEEFSSLYGRKSPINRVSTGGSVYSEPADSPQSFASLDNSDIGVKKAQGFGNVADTPTSIGSNDILVDRISTSGVDVDDIGIAPPPMVSNPLSGDESWEASSPESLSPNAPVDDDDDFDEDPLIADIPVGDDPFDSKKAFLADGVPDSPDEAESGFAELSAANTPAATPQMPLVEAGIESKDYRALVEMSSDSDSLLTHSSPMDDFDPFAAASPPFHQPTGPCADVDTASPCGLLAPEMTGLSLEGGVAVNAAAAPKKGTGILMDDLLMGSVKEGSPFADAASAGSSSGKESSPFGSNGFPEAQAFNDLVQQQVSPTDDFDPISAIPSSYLSPTAPEFTLPSSDGVAVKAASPALSPDAPVFVPATIPEEEAAAIVDSWGPPLGLPPAKPAATTGGAKPKSAAPGAKARAGSSATARPGTASRRAASPASSTASGSAARKGSASGVASRRGVAGSAKSSPPPPAIVPFYVDVAYVPTQGKAEALGKFFRRVRAKNYVLSCVDSPASTLDALLDAKENDWKLLPAATTSGGDDSANSNNAIPTTNVIPTHEGETLRSWIPLNLERMKKLAVEIAVPAEKCTLQLQGHGDVKSACYVLACN